MTSGPPRAEGHPLEGCAVVMAHPDDEILWAGSVLRRAARTVLCFGPLAGVPNFGPARARVVERLPIGPVDFLAIPEAGSWLRADWSNPQTSAHGLVLRDRWLAAYPNAPADYAANFERLSADLCQRLAGVSDVVTHNPWGEYGHEDHVLVLRAVCAAQSVCGFRVWVSNYVSQKSMRLMLAQRHRLGAVTPPLPVDHELAAELRDLYIAEGVWTWMPDYVWPETERFFLLRPDGVEPLPVTALPLNVICTGWSDTALDRISERGRELAIRMGLRPIYRKMRKLR